MSQSNNCADIAPLTFPHHLIFDFHKLSSLSLIPSFPLRSGSFSFFFCCCSFLPGPSHTRDPPQFCYGCSTSPVIAEGSVCRQNRDILRVAECGEDNRVKRGKSRLPTMTKQPPSRPNMTDICSGDQVAVQTNKQQGVLAITL